LHIAINPLTTASLAVSGAGIDRASIAISRANPMGEYGGDSGWDGGGTLRRGATPTFLRKSYIKKRRRSLFNPLDLRGQTSQLHILPRFGALLLALNAFFIIYQSRLLRIIDLYR